MHTKTIFTFITLGMLSMMIMAGCSGSSSTTIIQGSSPVIQSLSVQGLPSAPGGAITATVTANSTQGLALTYTWTTYNGWSVISGGSTPTATIQAPSTYAASGTVTVQVSDTYGRYVLVPIPVSTVGNSAPVIDSMSTSPITVRPGGMMTATVSTNDPDGDTLAFTWSVPPGWRIASGQGTSAISITAPASYNTGGYITVTISDGHGESVQGTLYICTYFLSPTISSIVVSPSPLNPSTGGSTTTATAAATATDSTGNSLTYTWSITSTTSGWDITGYGATATVISPFTSNSTAAITVMVDNGKGGAALSSTDISSGVMVTSSTVGTWPYGIAIDASGNIWTANHAAAGRISETTSSGAFVRTVKVGSGPIGIAIDASGNIWTANWSAGTISETTSSGAFVQTVTVGLYPHDIAIDASGNIWTVNNGAGTISETTSSGAFVRTVTVGSYPYSIAIDASGNIWTTNYVAAGTISETTSSGGFVRTVTVGTWPEGIAIDASGNVWTVNNGAGTISETTSSGAFVTTVSVGSGPENIAIDASGNIWTVNNGAGTISETTSSGAFVRTVKVGSGPVGIAIDASGNVWVTNYAGDTISDVVGVTTGPQYFPCSYFTDTSCPQFQGGGNY